MMTGLSTGVIENLACNSTACGPEHETILDSELGRSYIRNMIEHMIQQDAVRADVVAS